MKTIDMNELTQITGGVMDRGDGQGCIPNPFPRPRPPFDPINPIDGGIPGGIGGWRPGWPNVTK